MVYTVAKYLMELTLQEADMVHQLPSAIAAGALFAAMKLIGRGSWVRTSVLTFSAVCMPHKPESIVVCSHRFGDCGLEIMVCLLYCWTDLLLDVLHSRF